MQGWCCNRDGPALFGPCLELWAEGRAAWQCLATSGHGSRALRVPSAGLTSPPHPLPAGAGAAPFPPLPYAPLLRAARQASWPRHRFYYGYIWDGTGNRCTAPIRNPLNKSHMPESQARAAVRAACGTAPAVAQRARKACQRGRRWKRQGCPAPGPKLSWTGGGPGRGGHIGLMMCHHPVCPVCPGTATHQGSKQRGLPPYHHLLRAPPPSASTAAHARTHARAQERTHTPSPCPPPLPSLPPPSAVTIDSTSWTTTPPLRLGVGLCCPATWSWRCWRSRCQTTACWWVGAGGGRWVGWVGWVDGAWIGVRWVGAAVSLRRRGGGWVG